MYTLFGNKQIQQTTQTCTEVVLHVVKYLYLLSICDFQMQRNNLCTHQICWKELTGKAVDAARWLKHVIVSSHV